VFDTCQRYGIDLEAALQVKMAYNKTRPCRHGGRRTSHGLVIASADRSHCLAQSPPRIQLPGLRVGGGRPVRTSYSVPSAGGRGDPDGRLEMPMAGTGAETSTDSARRPGHLRAVRAVAADRESGDLPTGPGGVCGGVSAVRMAHGVALQRRGDRRGLEREAAPLAGWEARGGSVAWDHGVAGFLAYGAGTTAGSGLCPALGIVPRPGPARPNHGS
jgi:hypothetical protein